MKETEEFLAATMLRYHHAETALHDGDPAPRLAMWSRAEPLTLFGAAVSAQGWTDIAATFEWLGRSMSACTSYENEVIAAGASGELAYTVAIEHTSASINGEPLRYELRVTTVFRREDGEWKVVHRHGDPLQSDGGDVAHRLLESRG
jgi:ketosteroid isomerase-like protein